jgi:hypothetical protein
MVRKLSHFNVFLQDVRARLAGKNVAVFVDRDELGAAAGLGVRVTARIQDEGGNEAGLQVADADACSQPGLFTPSDSESAT